MPFITTEEAKWRLENSPMDVMLNKYKNSTSIQPITTPHESSLGSENKVEGDPTPG
jgi:hypothetical protein